MNFEHDALPPENRLSRRALVSRGGGVLAGASAAALLHTREAEAAPSGTAGATWTLRAEATGYLLQDPAGASTPYTEPGAALQRAINALSPGGGQIMIATGVYQWGSTPEIPGGLLRRLRILGDGGTIIRLSAAAPSFLAFKWPTADHQIFGNVEVAYLTVDANNVGGNTHVVIGSVHSSGNPPRANYEDVYVHDVVARSLPTIQSQDGRCGVLFQAYQANANEATQTTVKRMRFERLEVRGGVSAVDVTGIGPNRPVNIRLDDIYISDCHHDTGITPTTGPWGSSFHVGGHGFGESVRVLHCTSRGIGDTGVEVNGMTDVVVEGCHVAEARGYGYYVTNWRAIDGAQNVTFRDCSTVRSTGTQGWGFRCNFNSAALGTMVLSNCRYQRKTSDPISNGEAVLFNTAMDAAIIDGFSIDIEGAQLTASPGQPPLIASWNQGNPKQLSVRNVVARVRGHRTVPTSGFSVIAVNGVGRFSIDDVDVTGDVTGAGDPVIAVDIGRRSSSDLEGVVSNVRGELPGVSLRKVQVAGAAMLKISGRILVSDVEAIATNSNCIKVDDNTNRAKVFLHNIGWRTPPTTSSLVPTASPYVHRNLTGYARTIIVSGAGVARIDISHDGTAFRTTGLTQGTIMVPNGGSIRVVYSGAVPTLIAVTL